MTPHTKFQTTRLIGRTAETRRLRQTVLEAGAGHGRALLIEGDIGMGKTRLLQDLGSWARTEGLTCLQGTAYAAERHLPYRIFIDAVTQVLRSDVAAGRTLAPLAMTLASYAPSLLGSGQHAAAAESSELTTARIFDAFGHLLRHGMANKRIVLLLDDLQWADPQSVALVHFLARQIEGTSSAVVATYREQDLSRTPLREALPSLKRLPAVDLLHLAPLSIPDTRAIVKEFLHYDLEISPAFLRLIFERTEGNPYFVQETLRALAAQGQIYMQGGRWLRRPLRSGPGETISVPGTLREALLLRVEDVPTDDRHVLETIASLGVEAGYELLARATACTDDGLDDALERLCRGGLLTECQSPVPYYRFSHPLLSAAVRDSMTMASLRQYQRRIAAALDAMAQPEPRVWASLARNGTMVDALGALEGRLERLLTEAERAWDVCAWAESAQLYEIALGDPKDTDKERSAVGLQRLGDVKMAGGDFAAAEKAWRTGPLGAELATRLGRLAWTEGDDAAAEEHLRSAVASGGQPEALSGLAYTRWSHDAGDDASSLAVSAMNAGSQEAGVLLELIRVADSNADTLGSLSAPAATDTGLDPTKLELLSLAIDLASDGRAATRLLDSATVPPVGLALTDSRVDAAIARLLEITGDWEGAIEAFSRAIEAQWEIGAWGGLPELLCRLGRLHIRRGRPAQATRSLVEAVTLVENEPGSRWPDVAALALSQAELALAEGAPARAQDVLTHSLLSLARAPVQCTTQLISLACTASIAAADLHAAVTAVEALEGAAHGSGHAILVARCHQAQGELLVAREDYPRAAEALEAAAATFSERRCPYDEACSRRLLGRVYRESGKGDAAAQLLQARELLEPLGAEPALRAVQGELTRLGLQRPRRKPRIEAGSVTERELELIGFVARRYKTEDIAARLFISTATVRTHVRNVFRKLAVSSRAELVMAARERGLLAGDEPII